MIKILYLTVFLLLLGIAVFDGQTRRVPNRVTHLLLLSGILLNFPGTPFAWLMTCLLLLGWKSGGIGGGDVKLWLALLWLTVITNQQPAEVAWSISFILTGLAQLGWRWMRKRPVIGVRSPGAWRILPYACWLLVVS